MSSPYVDLTGDMRLQPSVALRYILATEVKIGTKNLFTSGKYKRYKELLIGAIFAQALGEAVSKEFFVVSTDVGKDPPDFCLREWLKKSPKSNKTWETNYNFEIVDYTEYSQNISEVIDKKLQTNLPKDYGIVVFFNHPTETAVSFKELINKYEDSKHWIIFISRIVRIDNDKRLNEGEWFVASLNKPKFRLIIKPNLTDKPNLPQCYIQEGRGRDKTTRTRIHQKIRFPE
jgi:hypothetical protein